MSHNTPSITSSNILTRPLSTTWSGDFQVCIVEREGSDNSRGRLDLIVSYRFWSSLTFNWILNFILLTISFSSLLSFPSFLSIVGGVDREDLARPSLKLTEEEEQADKVRIKSYGDVDQVLGRRKNGESYDVLWFYVMFCGEVWYDEVKCAVMWCDVPWWIVVCCELMCCDDMWRGVLCYALLLCTAMWCAVLFSDLLHSIRGFYVTISVCVYVLSV